MDSVKLMELNNDVKFIPSDLKSKDKIVKEKAVAVIMKVTIINEMCNESLESNVLQGVRAYEDNAGEANKMISTNAFKASKKNMSRMKRRKTVVLDDDELEIDVEKNSDRA